MHTMFLNMFNENFPAQRADLLSALGGGDKEVGIRVAHTVKGAAANIGFEAIRAAAETLEHALRDGRASMTMLEKLDAAVQATSDFLGTE